MKGLPRTLGLFVSNNDIPTCFLHYSIEKVYDEGIQYSTFNNNRSGWKGLAIAYLLVYCKAVMIKAIKSFTVPANVSDQY